VAAPRRAGATSDSQSWRAAAAQSSPSAEIVEAVAVQVGSSPLLTLFSLSWRCALGRRASGTARTARQ
jgi:hypothetical protein